MYKERPYFFQQKNARVDEDFYDYNLPHDTATWYNKNTFGGFICTKKDLIFFNKKMPV